jgi:hypothetical protein
MIYKRGDFGISVSQVDGFGKRPSLWLHNKNSMLKVASFGNEEKAKLFLAYLDWFVLINAKPPKEE